MELIDIEDFLGSMRITRLRHDWLVKRVMHLTQYSKFTEIYSEHAHKDSSLFLEAVMQTLRVETLVDELDMKRIPEKGAFVIVANHPYAGLDGLALMHKVLSVRSDFKMLVDPIFSKIQPIVEHLCTSEKPQGRERTNSVPKESYDEMRKHLEAGGCLAVFPSGNIASYSLGKSYLVDRQWRDELIRFIRQMNVPVVPVYFDSNELRLSGLMGQIHPLMRLITVPKEFLAQKAKTLHMRVGHPILVRDQQEFTDLAQYGRFLRAKTYALGSRMKTRRFFARNTPEVPIEVEQIVDAVPQDLLYKEIEAAKEKNLLFDLQEFSVICAPASVFPNVLQEIGRLREVTFREVGEGTNLSIDLDEYDLYYMQLVVWDNVNRRIVGAYRVGMGKDILVQYGKQGFYTHSLFKMKSGFEPVLEEALELGRSFIVKEYQRKPLSLFLLWKGILYFLLKNPDYRYLIGPVSISNSFTEFTKDLIVRFVESNFFNYEVAKNIVPRKKYKPGKKYYDEKTLFIQSSNQDFKRLDKFIRDIEPELVTPVLLKKYISLNAKIIGFNTDPKFNNCLDGLILLDVHDLPMDTLLSLSREINDDSILHRFDKDLAEEINR